MRTQISQFCADIGCDSLLVQGAGGNVSWKVDDILWVKASGTWLAEAKEKDIFVPVDLLHLQAAIVAGNYDVVPRVSGQSDLRPSIETLLHALLPHRIVVHFHAVDVLAYLVRQDANIVISEKMGDAADWIMVDYQKPGPDLAKAVFYALKQKGSVNTIFLKNHGVVIGGKDVLEVRQRLKKLLVKLAIHDLPEKLPLTPFPAPIKGYEPVSDACLHHLACDSLWFLRLASDWAIYPDHIVFLGPQALCCLAWDECKKILSDTDQTHKLVFVKGAGVYVTSTFTRAQLAQLRCYYDVLLRQSPETRLAPLSEEQVADLLEWDAEKYRQQLSASASPK